MTSPIRLNHLQVAPVSPGGRNWNSTNLLKVDLNQKKPFIKRERGPNILSESLKGPIGYKGPKLSTGARRRDVKSPNLLVHLYCI